MSHTVKQKPQLLNRVRRIRGQIEAVERALEAEADCGDILQRVAAARGALNALMAEILEGHLRQHILTPNAGRTADRREFADDFVAIVRAYLK
jgi:FrmR/RcnR family transcriptional regulator, repressor of frmRAB operon